MSKVLKNYKLTGEYVDNDYPVIKIKNDEDVYADLPVCAAEYNTFYKEPVLLMEINKIPLVVEKQDLLKRLSLLKKFYFLVNDETGEVQEVEPDQANLTVRLPHNTPVKDLIYQGGEILLVEQANRGE